MQRKADFELGAIALRPEVVDYSSGLKLGNVRANILKRERFTRRSLVINHTFNRAAHAVGVQGLKDTEAAIALLPGNSSHAKREERRFSRVRSRKSNMHFDWSGTAWKHFGTGVWLHSHTLCSRETLGFIYRLASRCLPIGAALRDGEARYLSAHGQALDLRRAWWTPPAAPEEAWLLLERTQIEDRLGLRALICLTDHDRIEVPLSLRALESCRNVPISTKWTVPYGPTFFHLGVHNMVPETAVRTANELARLTAAHRTIDLAGLLQSLAANRQTLIVFNHPCWDEKGIGKEQHLEFAMRFARTYGEFLHAFELNGLRPWSENQEVVKMARALEKPVISGGDRHVLEPNSTLDLTDAATVGEYVEHVRSGWTDVLIANHYREPFGLRIFRSLEEILGDQDTHRRGWRKWDDRVFFRCDDGVVRSLTELIPDFLPGAVQLFVKGVAAIRRHGIRRIFNQLFPTAQEFAS